MKLPFSIDQFFQIFKDYNKAIWPLHIAAYLLGLLALIFVLINKGFSDKIINGVLSLLWLWMGIVYHILFFSKINQAAYLFGGFFILQGLLFFWTGFIKQNLSYQFQFNIYALVGFLFILYAILIYPVLGMVAGHGYPHSPSFGLAPCPTVIFTLGMFLLSQRKIPWYILVIPFLWSLVGSSAAWSLGVKEDYGLLVAGIVVSVLILVRNKNIK